MAYNIDTAEKLWHKNEVKGVAHGIFYKIVPKNGTSNMEYLCCGPSGIPYWRFYCIYSQLPNNRSSGITIAKGNIGKIAIIFYPNKNSKTKNL